MGICEYLGVEFKTEKTIEESKSEILRKTIDVAVNGEKDFTEGYFADGKNLFTADLLSANYKSAVMSDNRQVFLEVWRIIQRNARKMLF